MARLTTAANQDLSIRYSHVSEICREPWVRMQRNSTPSLVSGLTSTTTRQPPLTSFALEQSLAARAVSAFDDDLGPSVAAEPFEAGGGEVEDDPPAVLDRLRQGWAAGDADPRAGNRCQPARERLVQAPDQRIGGAQFLARRHRLFGRPEGRDVIVGLVGRRDLDQPYGTLGPATLGSIQRCGRRS